MACSQDHYEICNLERIDMYRRIYNMESVLIERGVCLKFDNTRCECLTLQATPLHRTQITPPHWTPPSRQPCGPQSTTLRTEPAPDGGPPTDPGGCPPTWAPDRVLPDHSISSSITNSICLFSNNLVTLIVNSHMIAWRSKSIYLQKIQCPIEMQNTWERERENIHVSAFVA